MFFSWKCLDSNVSKLWISLWSYLSSNNIVISLIAEFICRAGIMYISDEGEVGQQLRSSMFSLSGTGFFGAVGRSINLGKN